MRKEGKVSKVAICERCNKMVMASHVDYLTKATEKEFTEFTNEGFIVKTETMEETKKRQFGNYKECSKGSCSQADA
jgi:hypothetical protein